MRCSCPVLKWTAADVGRLTGVPVRTVQDWRSRDQLGPSIPVPPIPVTHVYGLRDLLAVRVAHDLHGRGIAPSIRQQVVTEVQALELNIRSIVASPEPLGLVFPIDEDLATDTLDQTGDRITRLLAADQINALPENDDPPFFHVYPLTTAAAEVVDSVDLWFNTHQIPAQLRPVWA